MFAPSIQLHALVHSCIVAEHGNLLLVLEMRLKGGVEK